MKVQEAEEEPGVSRYPPAGGERYPHAGPP